MTSGFDCFARTNWAGIVQENFGAVLSVRWREQERTRSSRVAELALHTAANHSRPASCVIDAENDAEDHPARELQKGH
jgi:hypothetical protein